MTRCRRREIWPNSAPIDPVHLRRAADAGADGVELATAASDNHAADGPSGRRRRCWVRPLIVPHAAVEVAAVRAARHPASGDPCLIPRQLPVPVPCPQVCCTHTSRVVVVQRHSAWRQAPSSAGCGSNSGGIPQRSWSVIQRSSRRFQWATCGGPRSTPYIPPPGVNSAGSSLRSPIAQPAPSSKMCVTPVSARVTGTASSW